MLLLIIYAYIYNSKYKYKYYNSQRQLKWFSFQTEQDTFVGIFGLKNLSKFIVQNLIYTDRVWQTLCGLTCHVWGSGKHQPVTAEDVSILCHYSHTTFSLQKSFQNLLLFFTETWTVICVNIILSDYFFFILHSPQKLIHVHDNGAYMFLQKNFITFAIITKDT